MNNPRKGSRQNAPYRGDEQQQAPSADARKSAMNGQHRRRSTARKSGRKTGREEIRRRRLLAAALQTATISRMPTQIQE